MKRSTFICIVAALAFVFGGMMFFAPSMAALSLGLDATIYVLSLLRGMGGLIIGSGLVNILFRNSKNADALKAIFLTNIVTHVLGLAADVWGVADGALTITKMAPIEVTHLFSGIGSLIYLISFHNKKHFA